MTVAETLLQQFLSRAFYDVAAAQSAAMVIVGDRLGLYRAMAGAGPMTVETLSERTGTAPRYVREWLLNQAAGGYVDPCMPDKTHFVLPDAQAAVLAASPPAAPIIAAYETMLALTTMLDDVVDAFRTGSGIDHDRYPATFYSALGRFSSTVYARRLKSWIIEAELDALLQKGIAVADVACGNGSAALLLATSYPASSFVGIDRDRNSIDEARRNSNGVPNLEFRIADASRPLGSFDLMTCFDALHDMADAAAFVAAAGASIAKDGGWLVCEPRLGNEIAEILNPFGRFASAVSTMHCVPVARALGGEGTGSVMGRQTILDAMRRGGFPRVREIEDTYCLVLQARR